MSEECIIVDGDDIDNDLGIAMSPHNVESNSNSALADNETEHCEPIPCMATQALPQKCGSGRT
eukprot:10040540-Prorocentrum_lima.AAC.1